MSARASAIVMGVCLAVSGVTAVVVPQNASAQQKDQKDRTVNAKVGAALQAASAAVKNKQFDVALAKIKEAEADKKNSYEQFKIYETAAFVYGAQKDYAKLATTYEKMLETPQFLGDQSPINTKTIAQLYVSLQQYPKAIEFGKRWLQDKPNDGDVLAMLGQAYYSTKDYKSCKDTMGAAVANTEKAGGKPAEALLQFVRSCSDSVGDSAASSQALEKLCRHYPKPDYWQAYLKRVPHDKDLASFHWYRLMNDVGALKSADDYTNYAQAAMVDYGVPGEAVRVLEDGFSKRILGGDEKKKMRQQNTLTRAKEAAQANKATWAQLAVDADSDPTGQKAADMGMAYFGSEQYDQAVSFLEKSVKKGNAKEPAHVKLTLAIAQLKKGQRDSARSGFKSVSSDPVLGKIADAWMLRSFN